MEGSDGDGQLVLCPDGTGPIPGTTPPRNIAFIGDADCKLDRYTQLGDFDPAFWLGVHNDGVPFLDAVQTFGTLEQEFALSPALTLTSITGVYDIDQDNLIRGSGSSNPTIAADFTCSTRQYTQELRLTSDYTNNPVNFMVGAFYQNADTKVFNRLRGNRAFNLPALLQHGVHDLDIESLSLFGQVLWQATDTIEVAAGARWTDEKRDHALFNYLTNSDATLVDPKLEADNVSPWLSVTCTPTDDLTLFAAYRRGFKSGSFNTISVDTTNPTSFGDETAKGSDVSLKARFFERTLALNLAAYYDRYSDLQVGASDLSETGAILLRTINAASATVKGIEFGATYNPSAKRCGWWWARTPSTATTSTRT
jgi:outer membrane receptor protein involved in Fe transport